MAEFISRAWRETIKECYREFNFRGESLGGFSFPCDDSGNVDVETLHPAALANYQKCLNGTFDVVDEGVITFERSYRHPSVIRCESCGNPVALGNFTNPCECGVDYNGSGCRLAPRHFWGEETGEHWTECV